MKKLLILIIPTAMVGLISCNQVPSVNNAMGDKNKATVDKYIQAAITGDSETMGGYLADNYKGYGPSVKDSADRAKAIADWKTSWDSTFSSIKYTRYEAQAINIATGQNKGDWVLEWGNVAASYKNGMPSVTFSFHGAYRLETDKIVFSVVYYNVADILTQQGFTFVPPGDKKADAGK